MDKQLVLQILEAQGLSLAEHQIAPAVAVYLIKNQTATDAQLVSNEDGTFKHFIRTKIGFFVDLFWGEAEPYVDEAINAAIPAARALANVPEPANP